MNKKHISFESATGIIDFPFTNDYTFRAILQNNQHNWPDRSLSYLCRNFDQVYRGQDYDSAQPVIHIGFLDFSLFLDDTQFYSTFMLMDMKTHQVFNDKFSLRVLYLNHINNATEEDCLYEIDKWAKLFKAKTWEELRMITSNQPYLAQAAKSLYVMNEDDMIRERCRAREEYERHERTMKKMLLDVTVERDSLMKENQSLVSENSNLVSENSNLVSENITLSSELEHLRGLLKENGIPIP